MRRAGRLGGLVVASAIGLAACTSSSGTRTAGPTVVTINPTRSTVTTTPETTLAGPVATVFDCGGGAYKPATLLVVCGVATTTVTGISWTTWTATGASGSGMVRLTGHSTSNPANLTLSHVVNTPNGPQFSVLQATWTGPSPNGKPSEEFNLAVAK